MKLFFLVLIVSACVLAQSREIIDLKDAPTLFEEFIRDYNRHYASDAEKHYRYRIFVRNLKEINKLNSNPEETAVFGITQYTDRTFEEVFPNVFTPKPLIGGNTW